jgi:hypothetical protein
MDDKCPFSDPSRHPSWPTPCHGHPRMPWHGCMVSVVSHGTMVGPTRRAGPRDATGPGGRPARGANVAEGWLRGQGGAGGFRKKPGGKEISRHRGQVSPDRP